jgi:hypothetical protein
MIVASRAIVAAAVDVRRDRICALLAGIKALLLTQSFFKVSSRRPERKQSLLVMIVRGCERRLLLHQIAKQSRPLCVGVSLVTKSLLFCVTSTLRYCKLRSRFPQLAELRVHVHEYLISRILCGESRLMFRDDLPGDIVALLAPVPRLPGEECPYAADILWEEVDASRSQVVGLN